MSENTDFITEIAQGAVGMIVEFHIAQQLKLAVENYTELDPDAISVKVGRYVVASTITHQVRTKVTDPITAKTVTRVREWKQSRKDKKNTDEEK